MDLKLQGKTAIVTGAASGIGRATAELLGAEGVNVVVADISESGKATVDAINTAGGSATFVSLDVRDPESVANAVEAAVKTYGSLELAVNAVGIPQGTAAIDETSIEEFDDVIAVNVRSTFLSMKYEVPALLKAGGGAIVNLTSIMGLTAAGGGATYAASKHAVLGLTRGAAQDYAERGIRINAVAPGTIDTPMLDAFAAKSGTVADRDAMVAGHPIGRLGRAEEIAQAIVWLLSDSASYVVGAPLIVDGGYTAH